VPSKAELAAGAATAIAPELVFPAELAKAIAATRTRRKLDPATTVVIPPRESEPFFKFGKDRVRIRQRKGVRYVTVDRAKGMSVAETLLAAVVVAGGVAVYEAAKDVERIERSSSNPANWLTQITKALDPENWRL